MMEQLIALVIFALIAIGGSILRKYVEKQQREQQAAKRDAGRKAQRQQWQGEYGKKGAEHTPQQPGRQPAAQRPRQAAGAERRAPAARHRRPRQAQPPRPAEAAEASPAAQAQRTILQQVRASAARREVSAAGDRLGTLGRAEFPTLATMSPAGLGTGTPITTGAASRPGRGEVDYIGGMLRGRNVARAVVLSEILGPPKGLQ
jgi:hypothetical protein